ncbi:hypothetical protein [Calothrix rhizosoleniae]|nr:hypothetical protein [Calothrix rhizosoleniae]
MSFTRHLPQTPSTTVDTLSGGSGEQIKIIFDSWENGERASALSSVLIM